MLALPSLCLTFVESVLTFVESVLTFVAANFFFAIVSGFVNRSRIRGSALRIIIILQLNHAQAQEPI